MYFGLCAPVSMGSLEFRGQAFASHGHGEVRDEEGQLHGGLGKNLNLDCKSASSWRLKQKDVTFVNIVNILFLGCSFWVGIPYLIHL